MSAVAGTLEPRVLGSVLIPLSAGAGADSESVGRKIRELWDAYKNSLAITYRERVLSETFRALAEEWRAATRFQSSMPRITEHPAYRAIVDLGDEVVPVLLCALQVRPEPWFTALREITGVDPVRPEQRGDLRAMTEAWLRWGRQHGLVR